MGEAIGTDSLSMGPNRGMATPFKPDFMFSRPLFGCSGSLFQARKPDFRPGSLESSLEASQAVLEASQTAFEASQTAFEAFQTTFEAFQMVFETSQAACEAS